LQRFERGIGECLDAVLAAGSRLVMPSSSIRPMRPCRSWRSSRAKWGSKRRFKPSIIDNRLEASCGMARYVGRVNGVDAAGAKLAEADHRVGFG